VRNRQLLAYATVCEDIKALLDPSVNSVAAARAVPHERCPVFDRCMYHGEFMDRKGLQCIPRSAQQVARYASEPGSSLDGEMRDYAAQAPIESLNGYYDPYSEAGVDEIITDRDEILRRTRKWAEQLMAEGKASESPSGLAPHFLDLVASARTTGGGIDTAVIEETSLRSNRSNGGVACDASRGPCSCGAWH
jgi:hypothetical protein